jgi:ABC-type multidrug transport system ATPase subunit
MVGLGHRLTSRVGTYSQGMRQRLALACALVNDPELLILDEPTNGLDPQGIADMRQLILQLSKEQGKTIIVSSHLLSEMEMIADQVLIIDKGKKIAEATMESLLKQAATLELQQQPQRRFFLEAYFLSLTTP